MFLKPCWIARLRERDVQSSPGWLAYSARAAARCSSPPTVRGRAPTGTWTSAATCSPRAAWIRRRRVAAIVFNTTRSTGRPSATSTSSSLSLPGRVSAITWPAQIPGTRAASRSIGCGS
ncbi:hypothetical protein [Nannocystis pusilla]|uniref:hypothetical protein n=1 Tax=Nannocystis pusilla TaxID=889268 RepID=UPI003B7A9C67